jgi:hypothetical protein
MGKFFELMRTGVFTDRHGGKYDITKKVLERLASTFDASKPPHITIGHPDTEKAPSLGIVEALKVVGDKLLFKPAKFLPEFAALVAQGVFPGRSAGLTRDLTRLDHVAFLSAQQPAIDGLAPIAEFSARPADEVSSLDVTDCTAGWLAEFGAPSWWLGGRMQAVAQLFRGVKNKMIEADGAEAAEAALPESALTRLLEEPPEESIDIDSPAFSMGPINEPPDGSYEVPAYYRAKHAALLAEFEAATKTISTMDAANQKLASDNAVLVRKVAELERAARLTEFGAWVEERIAEGRAGVLPDRKAEMVDCMEKLFQLNGAEFSRDPVEFPYAIDIYKKDIMNRPLLKLTAPLDAAEFAAGGRAVESVEFGRLIREYVAAEAVKGVRVTTAEAAALVIKRDGLRVV